MLQLSGKCAVTGISLEEKGGIIASVEALTEESRLLGLSSLLGLDAFDFGDLSTLNALMVLPHVGLGILRKHKERQSGRC